MDSSAPQLSHDSVTGTTLVAGTYQYGDDMQCRQRRGRVVFVAVAATVALLVACSSDGQATSWPQGFDTAQVRVRRADGSICTLCTLVARTAAQQQRGLMGVRSLGGYDAMTFVFATPSSTPFWMRNTRLLLTGVWFGPDGGYLDSIDMQPCDDNEPDCPRYGPGIPASTVLEFVQGDAAQQGIGEGSMLIAVGGPCDPTDPTESS